MPPPMSRALPFHYYEVRSVDEKGKVHLRGRSYRRKLTGQELAAIQSDEGPITKVQYMGGGSNPIPGWWVGRGDSWTVVKDEGK